MNNQSYENNARAIALDADQGLDQAQDRTRVLAAAMAAVLFGAFLFTGIGFAQSSTIHNATHDARHAFALPCH